MLKTLVPKTIKKVGKYIDIYYINYITTKNHLNVHSVNPFYLVFNKIDGYVEENNGNKSLVFVSTSKSKEILTKYTEVWNKSKSLIETVDDNQVNIEDTSWKSSLIKIIIWL